MSLLLILELFFPMISMMERMSVLLIFVFPLDSLTWILIISLMDLECFVYLWHRSKCHVQSIGVILMIAFDLRIFHSSTSDHFLSLSQHMLHLIPFQSWHDQRMTILFIPIQQLNVNWRWIGDGMDQWWISCINHNSGLMDMMIMWCEERNCNFMREHLKTTIHSNTHFN